MSLNVIRRCCGSNHPMAFGSSSDPSRPRMSVAWSPRRSPTCLRRKRLRPGAGWWGAVPRRPSLRVSSSLLVWIVVAWSLVCVCVGNPDLWDRGSVTVLGPFFCGLFAPAFPIAWAQVRARMTISVQGHHRRFVQTPRLPRRRLNSVRAVNVTYLHITMHTSMCRTSTPTEHLCSDMEKKEWGALQCTLEG